MAGSTNFQQWNPGQVNQETDAQYTADSQRTGGAPNGTPFPSQTGNKLFYQLSTGITALMQMMSTKGFNVNDTNIGTLASVLSAIQTTADLKNPIQNVPYSASLVLDASKYSGFEIAVNGNLSFTITGASPGQVILFIFKNDGAGHHTVTFPSNWYGAWQPDPTGGVATEILIAADTAGTNFGPLGAMISNSGINSTPIGQVSPASGSFTSLLAQAATLIDLIVNGNPTINGSLGVTGVVQAAKVISSEGSGATGGFSFTQDGSQDTGLFSPSDGSVSLYSNSVETLRSTTNLLTALVAAVFNGLVTLNGGTLNGTYGGNPTLNGTLATNVATTNTPSSTDNSSRIPNTAWVQGLFAASGFSFNANPNAGHIKLPSFLGGFMIQWGTVYMPGSSSNTNPTPFNFDTGFPTAVLNIVVTTNGGADRVTFIESYNTVGGTMSNNGSGVSANYIAVGY